MTTKFLENKLEFPPRFIQLKRELVRIDSPETQTHFVESWKGLLKELGTATSTIERNGSESIPQVDFTELTNLSSETINKIKKAGCVVIRNIVDDDEALRWKQSIKEYIAANSPFPGVPDVPSDSDKQFFYMYWSKSQLKGRSHPNVLASQRWLNSLYHTKSLGPEGDSLKDPLVYADRVRIRNPGPLTWRISVPHIDSGSIERWEDPTFRGVYKDILAGNWRAHDPYDLDAWMNINSDIYDMYNQTSVFRTFQGWLSMSDTGPGEGTLKVFPDIKLSNAYILLRPFFRPVKSPVSEDPLDPSNWEFDISSSDFPGIYPTESGQFRGPWVLQKTHPHLNLENAMVSVPHVKPGDMVYWHTDAIHAVETEHHGLGDSSVMYIPALPSTPTNLAYVRKQRDNFMRSSPPPDFEGEPGEAGFKMVGVEADIVGKDGRRAMGLAA